MSLLFDCFIFWKELDLLELRLHELGSVVDYFIVVQATYTFAGQPKPLHFANNRDRFAQFEDKLVHVVVDDLLSQPDPWSREYYQRNYLLRPLLHCEPDDTIIISDVDEIPAADLVAEHATFPGITTFIPRPSDYFLNCRGSIAYSGPALSPTVSSNKALCPSACASPNPFPNLPQQLLHGGGWHFSFLGSAKDIQQKVAAYAHQEYNRPPYTDMRHILACMEAGNPFGRTDHVQFRFVPIDETFPWDVRENPDRFAPYIYEPEEPDALVSAVESGIVR